MNFRRRNTTHCHLSQKIALLQRKGEVRLRHLPREQVVRPLFRHLPGRQRPVRRAPSGFTPANQTPSFTQHYLGHDAAMPRQISPFLMPQAVQVGGYGPTGIVPIYPADEISVDHSHQGMANDLDVNPTTGVAANDRYAMDQEGLTTNASGTIVTEDRRRADLDHAGAEAEGRDRHQPHRLRHDPVHVERGRRTSSCSTISTRPSSARRPRTRSRSSPASRARRNGRCTPNRARSTTYANAAFPNVLRRELRRRSNAGHQQRLCSDRGRPRPVPRLQPRHERRSSRPTTSTKTPANPALNLTFATQPLSFMGSNIERSSRPTRTRGRPARRAGRHHRHRGFEPARCNWGWYQQGFNANDALGPLRAAKHRHAEPDQQPGPEHRLRPASQRPAIFRLSRRQSAGAEQQPARRQGLLRRGRRPDAAGSGGVFYLRGGYDNNDGLVPVDPTPADPARVPRQRRSPGLLGPADLRGLRGPGDQRHRQQPVLVGERHHHHLRRDRRLLRPRPDPEAQHLRRRLDPGGRPAHPDDRDLALTPPRARSRTSYSEHGSVIKFINEL